MQACLRANDPRRALRHVEALEAEAAEQQSEGEGGAPLSPGIISQLIIALSRSDAECALKARGMHAGLAARGRCPSVGASTALISQVLLLPLLLLPAPLPPPTPTTTTFSQLIRYNELFGAAQTMAEMGAPNADSAWSLNVLEARHISLCTSVRAVLVSALRVFPSPSLLRS